MSTVTIEQIALADEPSAWRALGFAVEGDLLTLGSIGLRLLGREAGRGILGWTLRGAAGVELDGLPTTASGSGDAAQPSTTEPSAGEPQPGEPRASERRAAEPHVGQPSAGEHPNGVGGIDHIVAFSPDLDRSVRALRDAGLDLRRVREQPTPAGAPRQAFFRLGEAILEVVQIAADELERAGGVEAPARFWGLALAVSDIDRTVAALGEHSSEPRPAVQPGRRIATLRRSAGLAVPIALIDARVAAA